MRATVNLADDVARAVMNLQRERGLDLSEAVNELARAGLATRMDYVYVHPTLDLGGLVDLTKVGDALEFLDEVDRSGSAAGPS